MNLFSKQKGTLWGILNGIILAIIVGAAVTILAILIFGFEHLGEYATRSGIYCAIGVILLSFLMLLIINKKYNLMDKSYPLSRRFFNGLFILNTLASACIFTCVAIVLAVIALHDANLLPSAWWFSLLYVFAALLVYIATLFITNFNPIFVSENSKALNVVNFFTVTACANTLLGTFSCIVDLIRRSNLPSPYNYTSAMDWRMIIFLACVSVGLAVLIYFLNFKKKKHADSSLPKTLHDTKKDNPQSTEAPEPPITSYHSSALHHRTSTPNLTAHKKPLDIETEIIELDFELNSDPDADLEFPEERPHHFPEAQPVHHTHHAHHHHRHHHHHPDNTPQNP